MLAWQDYMATGVADLAKAYIDRLLNDTMHQFIDSTGVISNQFIGSTVPPHTMTGHIIGWDPNPGSCDPKPDCINASVFHVSDHETPCNAWAVHGLEVLARLAELYGDLRRAAALSKEAGALRANIMRQMFNATAGRFCDGLCSDANSSAGSVYTDFTTMFLGLVPTKALPGVWRSVASHGIENMGAYGAFLYLNALARYPDAGDDGAAILTALTKCDDTSWCAEW